MEPAINMMALRELVKLMHNDSEIDFRNTLLDPPVPMNFFKGGSLGVTAKEDKVSQLVGDTMGDL